MFRTEACILFYPCSTTALYLQLGLLCTHCLHEHRIIVILIFQLCIRAADANAGKDGKEVVSVILPVLLDTGITNLVKEVRSVRYVTHSAMSCSNNYIFLN